MASSLSDSPLLTVVPQAPAPTVDTGAGGWTLTGLG